MSTTLIVSNAADTIREWVLAGGTVVLAVFTLLLWRSTHSMAMKTGLAAEQAGAAAKAASESTEIARQALALESERWQIELMDRTAGHARLVEVHTPFDPSRGTGRVTCTNRGPQTISQVAFHIKIGDEAWTHWDPLYCSPGESVESRVFSYDRERYDTPAKAMTIITACVTFTDADGRPWLRWAHNDHLEPYSGNLAQITAAHRA